MMFYSNSDRMKVAEFIITLVNNFSSKLQKFSIIQLILLLIIRNLNRILAARCFGVTQFFIFYKMISEYIINIRLYSISIRIFKINEFC